MKKKDQKAKLYYDKNTTYVKKEDILAATKTNFDPSIKSEQIVYQNDTLIAIF